MGVPKFFRWISERYPAISQLISENRIPEFDNLYLDMNGIIHNCTHKDSDSPNFRMTEDKMFIGIFNYIEHLFGKIKPRRTFFMAIDGVAPRAKMNQQRSRRFRTALDAEKAREKAMKEGQEMPTEAPFDSNCITPGTEFMARLTEQLKYFIAKKVTEDSDWQGVEIILSGHEVPGEGEHKIMEYIRYAKAQPDYDYNVRHCLYGLDADLIMLGLLSHDPHFCLLREEVTFGRQSLKKSKELEHQNFYLMHLCMVREYLELEFQQLKQPGILSFPFDMERVIDDFILMGFFVGNDFLPNIPHLHINEGALSLMFDTYKKVLPTAEGYINEGGYINLPRLALLLDELSKVELRFFEAENHDAGWLKSKQRAEIEQNKPSRSKKHGLVITPSQKQLFKGIKKWINSASDEKKQPYDLSANLPESDRNFVKDLADSLRLDWSTPGEDRHMRLAFPSQDQEEEEEEEESQTAVFRVLKQYDNAKVAELSADAGDDEVEKQYQEKFYAWRNKHYQTKFGWGLEDTEEVRKLTENYVQGLQWVLLYYYRGVASWPWFFQYHYSPMIADVKKGLGANMNFTLGQPFHPFEQLMGVLPDRSKSIVPTAFHELMTSPDSPIIDFYPRDFELDMDGKKMEWEAVVKIPFIQEDRLLAAMKTRSHLLTNDERKRNEFGVGLCFVYSRDTDYVYPSSLPGVFNDIPNCKCIQNIFDMPPLDSSKIHVGLTKGAKLGVLSLAGFPSLKVLPFDGQLAFHGVTIFQQESRNQSMVVTLRDVDVSGSVEKAKAKLGKVVHVGFPYLQEARVLKVTDEMFDYSLNSDGTIEQLPHESQHITSFHRKAERLETHFSKRLGTVIGPVEVLLHVEMLIGLRKTEQGATVKEYGDINGVETEYAAQTIVDKVMSEDLRFVEREALPIQLEFPVGSRAFFMGDMAYGRPVEVAEHAGGDKVDIWVNVAKGVNETWGRGIALAAEAEAQYQPGYAVARMLKLNPLVLSRLTSSLSVVHNREDVNLGLNMKFESRKQKVLGYSRRGDSGWEYSKKAVSLITEYMVKFPTFIAGLQRNPKGDKYQSTDLFSDPTEADVKIKELVAWLKSFNSKSFERVPLDANQLDSEACLQIEQAADQQLLNAPMMDIKKIRAVPRHALLKPSDAQYRLNNQDFLMGDRVIYCQDSGKVPLGLSATVVGVTLTGRGVLLDLVCDTTFMSGNSLNDRCSPFRGAAVPSTAVLNLTERQLVVDTRASSARSARPSQPYYVSHHPSANGHANGNGSFRGNRGGRGGYGAPTGPNGQGQLFDSQAPAPLQGSYSGAARGQLAYRSPRGDHGARGSNGTRGNNATRGRGRGRAGYTIIDNSDPMEGVQRVNPNFRPRPMRAVPPPSSLDGRTMVGPDGAPLPASSPRGNTTNGTPRGQSNGTSNRGGRGNGRGRGG